MGIDTLIVLVAGLFTCLAVASGLVARAAARDCRSITRQIRSQLAEIDVQTSMNTAHIKRLTGSVGALGRWANPSKPETPDGLPDPAVEPEKWRAAVRRMSDHQRTKG